ncbi:MAG: DEAD/DEAH box helicase, partial [Crocinitomicaceae bacterium]
MTFQDLNLTKPLLNALNDLGYTTPTTIQEKGFSVMMSGKDVLGIAQTGTGKTLAYLLPTLRQWNFSKERFPQILIIVPTRELVAQVVEEVEKLTKYMNVVTVGVYGGANIKTQSIQIAEGLDVLVATPGRLMDLALKGDLALKNIKKLIIDEVDETLNLGFRRQLTTILDILPTKKQSLLFSATITDEVETLIEEYFISPVKIEAAPTGTPLENIAQFGYHVPNFNTKINLLHHLLETEDDLNKVLIFVESKKFADRLFEQVEPNFPGEVGVIHSNKAQNNRFNTVKSFQSGEYRILIATDIISRGLDISEVTHVINFDTPDVAENYIHRIGRTGRYDKEGISITLISPHEIKFQEEIEKLMNRTITLLDLPEGLEISTELTDDEIPKVVMPNVQIKLPKRDNVGAAFHEK